MLAEDVEVDRVVRKRRGSGIESEESVALTAVERTEKEVAFLLMDPVDEPSSGLDGMRV